MKYLASVILITSMAVAAAADSNDTLVVFPFSAEASRAFLNLVQQDKSLSSQVKIEKVSNSQPQCTFIAPWVPNQDPRAEAGVRDPKSHVTCSSADGTPLFQMALGDVSFSPWGRDWDSSVSFSGPLSHKLFDDIMKLFRQAGSPDDGSIVGMIGPVFSPDGSGYTESVYISQDETDASPAALICHRDYDLTSTGQYSLTSEACVLIK